MKKEVVIAIIVGFALGLAITFGIYTAQKALKNKSAPPPTTSAPTETAPAHSIVVTAPDNEELVTTSEVSVSGTTTPSSSITIISPESQIITTADDQGGFNATTQLAGGANPIQITSFAPDGSQAQAEIVIVYSTQFEQSSKESDE